jgi:hypothetical protein
MSWAFQFIFTIYLFLFANNPPPFADLILLNGKTVTVDKNFTIAKAVATKKDKIIAVWSNKKVRKFANKQSDLTLMDGKVMYSSGKVIPIRR